MSARALRLGKQVFYGGSFQTLLWTDSAQIYGVKGLMQLAGCVGLLGAFALPAPAAFTSLYVFGDGVSTTTNGPGGAYYYGRRYCNGRVWVELLAQQQGLTYESNKNWSYFGHYSPNLVTNVNAFAAPPDASTALFVVWVNNADFVYGLNRGYGTNISLWTNAINQSLTNHFRAVTNLYAKGARTLIMPSAVDLMQVPYYVNYAPASKRFVRQQIQDFNAGFVAMLNQAQGTRPGLTIHAPDFLSVLDKLVAHAPDFGLTNALKNGQTVDALQDPSLPDKTPNGRGTNHIFWDNMHPTAKVQARILEEVQQLLSPARISSFSVRTGWSRLELTSLPLGRNGFVEGSTNGVDWTSVGTIISTNATQVLSHPAIESQQFYRLRFPFSWAWP